LSADADALGQVVEFDGVLDLELSEVQAQLFELKEKMQSLQDTVERTVVRSPQAGALTQLLRGPDITVISVESGIVEVTGSTPEVIGETAAAMAEDELWQDKILEPPVVAGVPLGRRRADVEHVLQQQGAVVVQKDDEATTYLGCPLGDGAAVTCVVMFQDERAASVTEVHPTPPEDDEALAAWKVFAARLATEIGRDPVTSCPPTGPERATGDCTAIWASERLVIVVGAHRNAGGKHRGGISVYTAWSYPPLAPEGGAAPGE